MTLIGRLPGSGAVWAMVLATAVLAGSPPLATGAITKEALDALTKDLEANGALWLKDEPVNPAVERQLKEAAFDRSSAEVVSAALRAIRKDGAGLYVTVRLLGRLAFCDTETIQAVLPAVTSVHRGLRNAYKPLPQFAKADLVGLAMPDAGAAGGTDAILKTIAAIEKKREVKVEREKPIAKHNEMVFEIETKSYLLMMLANDPKQDKQIMDDWLAAEKRETVHFLMILELVGAQAAKMDQERAKTWYNWLKPHAIRLRMENRKAYTHPGRAILRRDDNSRFDQVQKFPGVEVLNTMNKLATAAKLSALNVPKDKEIEEFHKKKK